MGQNRSRTVFLFAGADAGAATSIRALSPSPSLPPSLLLVRPSNRLSYFYGLAVSLVLILHHVRFHIFCCLKGLNN